MLVTAQRPKKWDEGVGGARLITVIAFGQAKLNQTFVNRGLSFLECLIHGIAAGRGRQIRRQPTGPVSVAAHPHPVEDNHFVVSDVAIPIKEGFEEL